MALDFLRQPLSLPDDPNIGSVRLREITLLDETTGGEIAVKAPMAQAQTDVFDLLSAWMPTDNPAEQERFRTIGTKVDLAFLPGASEAPDSDSAQLILKRRGGHNLTDFSAALQGRLEAWLSHRQSAIGLGPNAGQPQWTA